MAPAAPVTDDQLVEAMAVYGGHFVQHLAAAWRRADLYNRKRLREAFPDLVEQYSDIARRHATLPKGGEG